MKANCQALLSRFFAPGLLLLSSATSAQDSPPGTAFTPPHIDPLHPLIIHYEYYPRESVWLEEEGTCFFALLIDIDGQIIAVQLLKSTGHLRLDAACIASVVNQRLLPATIDGKAAVGWLTTSVSWAVSRNTQFPNRSIAGLALPKLPNDYELQVGAKFYPATALERKESGICVVHLLVNAKGSVAESHLSKSTGFHELDRACMDAVTLAEFTPAQAPGEAPILAWTDIAMIWRLPKH